jgi:hypothetical protein
MWLRFNMKSQDKNLPGLYGQRQRVLVAYAPFEFPGVRSSRARPASQEPETNHGGKIYREELDHTAREGACQTGFENNCQSVQEKGARRQGSCAEGICKEGICEEVTREEVIREEDGKKSTSEEGNRKENSAEESTSEKSIGKERRCEKSRHRINPQAQGCCQSQSSTEEHRRGRQHQSQRQIDNHRYIQEQVAGATQGRIGCAGQDHGCCRTVRGSSSDHHHPEEAPSQAVERFRATKYENQVKSPRNALQTGRRCSRLTVQKFQTL